MRLHKYIAGNSTISRRKAEELIERGKVKVNGKVVVELGTSVDPKNDEVHVNGEKILFVERQKYFMLNKPAGYICAVSDPHGEKTILELLPEYHQDVYPVGRLDKDSTGLIFLTNDGDFAYKYTHPKFDHEKEYIVNVNGVIDEKTLKRLNGSFIIDDYKTNPAKVSIVVSTPKNTHLSVILKEGRKRQIREMVKQCGKKVLSLKRIRIDDVMLGDLEEGNWGKLDTKTQEL